MFPLLDPADSSRLSRREWLRVGGLSAAGLTLPALLRAQSASSGSDRAFGQAKACIFLFMGGGPPQHETWDPKPDAPAEIRGDLKPIATSLPGLQVGELMPRTARLAHRICVMRAMSTNDNAHSASGYWMLTGHPHAPMNQESSKPGAPNDSPSLAAIIRHLRKDAGQLPSSVILPEHIRNNPNVPWPGQFGGFLGRTADPWLLTCEPEKPNFEVPELGLPADVPALRFDERRSLLEQVNRHLDELSRTPAVDRNDVYQVQALDLLRSPSARQAFDLDKETVALRDRYGRHKFGQSVLLARRLIEAGVVMVQVNWPREPGDSNSGNPLWDTHSKNTERLKTALMPPMDQAFTALIEDLDDRGLLDSTLIFWAGEFGRSPKINGSGGRDHWGNVFSAALVGGGIRGGQVIGASDKIGGSPKESMVRPQDVHATILHCLGHGSGTEMRDVMGRVSPVCKGSIIRQMF